MGIGSKLPSKLPLHALIEVIWLDAGFDLDADPGLDTLHTVGYLLRQTPELVLLAGEANSKLSYFRAYTCIPAGMIKEIRQLGSNS